jgi:hypothetical protein
MRSPPQTVTVAAILLALFSVLWDLSFPLWAQAISTEEELPVFIVYLTVVVGVTGLVGAAGLWRLRKWSLWPANVVSVLNLLDGASGVAGASYAALRITKTRQLPPKPGHPSPSCSSPRRFLGSPRCTLRPSSGNRRSSPRSSLPRGPRPQAFSE